MIKNTKSAFKVQSARWKATNDEITLEKINSLTNCEKQRLNINQHVGSLISVLTS